MYIHTYKYYINTINITQICINICYVCMYVVPTRRPDLHILHPRGLPVRAPPVEQSSQGGYAGHEDPAGERRGPAAAASGG